MSVEHWWNDTDKENTEVHGCPSATLCAVPQIPRGIWKTAGRNNMSRQLVTAIGFVMLVWRSNQLGRLEDNERVKMAAFPEIGYTAATERNTLDWPLPHRTLSAGIEVFSDNFRLRLSSCAGLFRRDRGAGRNTTVGREREALSSVKPLHP